jgi:transcription elongation factor Elf1
MSEYKLKYKRTFKCPFCRERGRIFTGDDHNDYKKHAVCTSNHCFIIQFDKTEVLEKLVSKEPK